MGTRNCCVAALNFLAAIFLLLFRFDRATRCLGINQGYLIFFQTFRGFVYNIFWTMTQTDEDKYFEYALGLVKEAGRVRFFHSFKKGI